MVDFKQEAKTLLLDLLESIDPLKDGLNYVDQGRRRRARIEKVDQLVDFLVEAAVDVAINRRPSVSNEISDPYEVYDEIPF